MFFLPNILLPGFMFPFAGMPECAVLLCRSEQPKQKIRQIDRLWTFHLEMIELFLTGKQDPGLSIAVWPSSW